MRSSSKYNYFTFLCKWPQRSGFEPATFCTQVQHSTNWIWSRSITWLFFLLTAVLWRQHWLRRPNNQNWGSVKRKQWHFGSVRNTWDKVSHVWLEKNNGSILFCCCCCCCWWWWWWWWYHQLIHFTKISSFFEWSRFFLVFWYYLVGYSTTLGRSNESSSCSSLFLVVEG